ncbi:MAG: hypothetical protein NTW38_07730 [Candidatus Aminicenantes bacterium]|nr:hypothetical protein [Candidatus Aminicenantes bacterium]
MMQPRRFMAAAVGFFLVGGFVGLGSSFAQDVLERKIAVPKLIGQADLDCSCYVLESAPQLQISSQVRAGENTMLSDGDLFYADPVPGTEAFVEDSFWSILEWGPRVRGQSSPEALGHVVFLRGRARVVRVESGRAVMEIVKSCGMITTGLLLVPYEKGEILTGPELDYDVPFQTENALTGRIVFTENDWTNIIARGHWALIDIGADQGLTRGTQMTIFRQEGKKPPQAVGNTVVVRAGGRWATVKILDSKDTILMGDFVQIKPI